MAFRFSFAKQYNTERLFDVDTSEYEYQSLEELYTGDENQIFQVCGIYINTKSQFGDAPVIATDFCYVNLPQHMLQVCNEILNDPKAIRAINEGRVGFTIYQYEQKRFGTKCYSIRWCDVDPNVI